ncbi:MAG: AAA family ATPase [Epsilonproteobacteria bacterium]|nr:AAA family ATPase [Campylobacterota bacterium]
MLTNLVKLEKRIRKELKSSYRRYFFDTVDFSSQMIAVVGSRGVGKTTFLLQYLKDLKEQYPAHKSLYFSYDYPTNVDIKLYELAEEFAKVGGEYLLLDEIHKYKNFALDLKAIYDFHPKIKVVFTGSCATSIYNSQADLSRRAVLYHMNGLSYREFLELTLDKKLPSFSVEEICSNSVSIVDKLNEEFIPLEYFEEYLKHGYYPFYFSDKNNYLKQLTAVVNLTIDVDLVMLGYIKPTFANKLKKLLNVICYSKPFELNITKVSANIEVSRNTLYAYLGHLKKGDLLTVVADNKKGLSSLSKPEKLYLNNTNLNYALCENPEIGTIREGFFANQLQESHELTSSKNGDFIVNGKYTFEIGGKNKGFKQIKDIENAFVVQDTDNTEDNRKIPLWLFGFLY